LYPEAGLQDLKQKYYCWSRGGSLLKKSVTREWISMRDVQERRRRLTNEDDEFEGSQVGWETGYETTRCVGVDLLEGIMGVERMCACVLDSIASTFHRQKKAPSSWGKMMREVWTPAAVEAA
jgi:hypothetical protein